MTHEEYEAYLQTDQWKNLREEALSRSGNRCRLCNCPENLQVHHRTYERIGNEDPSDLTALCKDCHEVFHFIQERKKIGPEIEPNDKPKPKVMNSKTWEKFQEMRKRLATLVEGSGKIPGR